MLLATLPLRTSQAAGRALTFMIAAAVVIIWAIHGLIFHYSDTWQLVINTGTTIVTFLMVFLIQNSQNRDSAAIQVKLDELVRVSAVHNSFVGIEHLTDDELERFAPNARSGKGRESRRADRREVPEESASRGGPRNRMNGEADHNRGIRHSAVSRNIDCVVELEKEEERKLSSFHRASRRSRMVRRDHSFRDPSAPSRRRLGRLRIPTGPLASILTRSISCRWSSRSKPCF